MTMLNLFYSGKKARPGPLAAPFFAHLPHDGNGSQESQPWAKEANPLFIFPSALKGKIWRVLQALDRLRTSTSLW
jgi:hypothetical protein